MIRYLQSLKTGLEERIRACEKQCGKGMVESAYREMVGRITGLRDAMGDIDHMIERLKQQDDPLEEYDDE